MLHNIDMNKLNNLKEHDPEAAHIIDTLLNNHKEIVSTISHEIRNPLTLVYSRLQMISENYPETAQFKFWDSTIEDVEFMKLLLEELATFNNSNTLHYSDIKTSEFLRTIALSFALTPRLHSCEITSDIPYVLPTLKGDKVKLREVFTNLLRNAKEAVGDKGNVFLKVAVDEEAQELVTTITDDGCGIPAEHLESIFEMFTTYKQGGTGLGLAISKSIVEAHGGSISVSSLPAVGTTFTVRLPIQESCE